MANSAGKVTYKKRKKGMMKKVSEVTILCGIPAYAIIISSPFDPKPETWPDSKATKQVIQRYMNASTLVQSNNVNQESFIKQRFAKAHDQLRKQRQDNLENQNTLSLFQYIQGAEDLPDTIQELKKLDNLIEKNMKEIENKFVNINSEST